MTQTTGQPADMERILKAIQGEYLEIPGLSLTHPQASRLFSLDGETTTTALSNLVNANFLQLAGNRYIRKDITLNPRYKP